MPMYFPDRQSVERCALAMRKNKGWRRYKGIVPFEESQLIDARKQLAEYFRSVWGDEIQAMEIEQCVSKENYDGVMGRAVISNFNLDKLKENKK